MTTNERFMVAGGSCIAAGLASSIIHDVGGMESLDKETQSLIALITGMVTGFGATTFWMGFFKLVK